MSCLSTENVRNLFKEVPKNRYQHNIFIARVLPISLKTFNFQETSQIGIGPPHISLALFNVYNLIYLQNKDYLLCDYNRDGDSYRSPWSNEYDPPIEDGSIPSDRIRNFEVREIFK